jgi:hypothetical protein
MSIISYPTPPESNPPIHPEYFKPSRFVITGISLGLTTIVTTSVPHNYVVGQQVRIMMPSFYGTYQINKQDGIVMAIPSPTQVLINLNSVGYNPFIPTPTYGPTLPEILAIGDIRNGAINDEGRYHQKIHIPGSFRNISPI